MSNIELMNYKELLDLVFDHYADKYSRRKFQVIFEKVNASKFVDELLFFSFTNQYIPSAKDFLVSINKNTYFLFSKQITTVTAAIIALHKWNLQVNEVFLLLPDKGLSNIVRDILIASNTIHYYY